MAENKKVMTVEEATALAKEIDRTEAALKQMKEQLKAFCKVNGPINTGEKVWDHTPSFGWKFFPNSLKQMAQDLALEGHNPWELFSLSANSLNKIGWSDDILRNYGEKVQTSTSFRSVKAPK